MSFYSGYLPTGLVTPQFPALTGALPSDFGYLGWTNDPATSTNQTATPAAGQITLTRFKAVGSGTIGHLIYQVTAAGVTLTSGQNFIGVYDSGQASAGNATLLATSADQTATWGGTGVFTTAMVSAAGVVNGGQYFVAVLSNGTTPPVFRGQPSGGLVNGNLSGLGLRFAQGGAATTFPSTIAVGSLTSAGMIPTVMGAP